MKIPFSTHDFRRLSAFLRAYLHEDFKLEYSTPEGALDAYRKHATPVELAGLKKEFNAFMHASESVPFPEVQTWWTRELGSAWLPADKNQLLALQQHLNQDDIK